MITWHRIDNSNNLLVSYIGKYEIYQKIKTAVNVQNEKIEGSEISFIISNYDSLKVLEIIEDDENNSIKQTKKIDDHQQKQIQTFRKKTN